MNVFVGALDLIGEYVKGIGDLWWCLLAFSVLCAIPYIIRGIIDYV